MKKIGTALLILSLLCPMAVEAGHVSAQNEKSSVISAQQSAFQTRRKQIKELIKKYKKAPESEKPAIKAELTQVVSQHVDAQMIYMKERIAAERANLDNWEKKIKEDEKNLEAVKAQRVEDLLSGEAAKKQKAAKKAWKKQMRQVKK